MNVELGKARGSGKCKTKAPTCMSVWGIRHCTVVLTIPLKINLIRNWREFILPGVKFGSVVGPKKRIDITYHFRKFSENAERTATISSMQVTLKEYFSRSSTVQGPLFFCIFLRSSNAGKESRGNWTPARCFPRVVPVEE